MEHATAQAQISDVHVPRLPKNPLGYKGKNVIVGIIDSALDVAHHAFRDPGSSHGTRVRYYWVQDPSIKDPTKTPAKVDPTFKDFDYGRLYTKQDINTALGLAGGAYGTGKNQICRTPSSGEHGTAVAGNAVGNGYEPNWATKPKHIGAAPEADIVHVTNTNPTTDKTIDALKFIFQVSEKEKKPVAVNISLGSNQGPHLGNDSFCQAIGNLLNSYSKRVVVSITQNWNDKDGFRRGSINIGNTDQFMLTPSMPGDIFLNIYYDVKQTAPGEPPPQSLPIILEYRISIGSKSTGWRKDLALYNYSGNLKSYTVKTDALLSFRRNNYKYRFITITIENASISDPVKIELRTADNSKRTYYAWVTPDPDGSLAKLSGAIHHELTLSNDGCCKSMLTVGACAKKIPPDYKKGESVAGYSGAGPTLDGRIKPEIVAVGGVADQTSPQFNPLWTANSDPKSDQKRDYNIGVEGTSFAAPLVTGAAALLFEEANLLGYKLNHDTVKALLIQNAYHDDLHLDPSKTDYVPTERNRYGYGRLRLLAPIDHLRPPVNVDVWIRTADDDYGHEPYIGDCYWASPDIKVFKHGTTKNEVTELVWGDKYDVKVIVRNLGDDKAVGTTVRLRYTRPWVAPNRWYKAEDDKNNKCKTTVEVPALGQKEVTFIKWRPERAELGAPPSETHFCLLAEAYQDESELNYKQNDDAWTMNIRNKNNVALRNVIIK